MPLSNLGAPDVAHLADKTLMTIDHTGIILYTLAYEACVTFYGETLGLPVEFSTPMLTCFSFGGAYLMVELDDRPEAARLREGRERTCLRLNVADVKAAAEELSARGVDIDFQEYDWGTVAKFFDPDGNLCALKDSAGYERQRGAA